MMNGIEKLISVSGGVSLLYVEDDLTLQQETAQLLRNFFEKIVHIIRAAFAALTISCF